MKNDKDNERIISLSDWKTAHADETEQDEQTPNIEKYMDLKASLDISGQSVLDAHELELRCRREQDCLSSYIQGIRDAARVMDVDFGTIMDKLV